MKNDNNHHKNIAFSLLEMSIVLLIVSILLVVILGAQDMIKGTAMRNIVKEVSNIHIAINNFHDAYNVVPGDTDIVYKYWTADCASSSFCNGDADNILEAYKESHLAWFHLSLAKLFKGTFTGLGDGDTQTQTAGVNVPKSSLFNGQYTILHYHWPEFPDEHMIILGAKVSGNIGYGTLLDANTAFELDTKLDDGKPSQGIVYGRNGWQNNNWTSSRCLIDDVGAHVNNNENHESNVEYNMNISTDECIMGFRFTNRIGLDTIRTATD